MPSWIICVFLLLLATEASQLAQRIYQYSPERKTSHCSRKLNTTGQTGCSSRRGGSHGFLYFANSSQDVLDYLNTSEIGQFILALDSDLFLNRSLMSILRSHENVAGIVVFSQIEDDDIKPFSEASTCPNPLYGFYNTEKQCNVVPPWNPTGSDYANFDWPFPVVLIRDGDARTHLLDCFNKFNSNPVDDTRCSLEIANHMSAVGSALLCSRRQSLMSVHIFESPFIYCDELTGVNIILSATNTTVASDPDEGKRSNSSSILVAVRTDSRSMFDRTAFASQSILPSISVLISVAAHLMRQPSFKNLRMKRDLFFAFLDNEAFDYMGSRRLNYDLNTGHLVGFTGFSLEWNHVHSIVELGEIGLPKHKQNKPVYFMNMDQSVYKKTKEASDELLKQFDMAAIHTRGAIVTRPSNLSTPLPPLTSVQGLLAHAPHPFAHLVFSDHDGPPFLDSRMGSFLDVRWPPKEHPDANLVLLGFANTLADGLHRLVANGDERLDANITYPTPGDLMDCFVNNPNCSLLRKFANPKDVEFLMSFGTPIPTQSYLPIDNREIKLSHLVNLLLMGLTGERTGLPTCPARTNDTGPYAYFVGYYNGEEHCYRTLLDLAYRFLLVADDIPVAPAWVRSRVSTGTSYVRWYRSASHSVDIFSIVLGVFLTLLTAVGVFGARNLINRELINLPRSAHYLEVDVNRDLIAENRHTTI